MTAKASAALSSVKKATLPTSPSDATPAWCHSPSAKSASTTRVPKPSPPRETRAPSSGTRGTAKLASLANSTLEITKAARTATMLLITPLAGQARRPLPHHLVSMRTTSSAFYSPSPRSFYDSPRRPGSAIDIFITEESASTRRGSNMRFFLLSESTLVPLIFRT